MQINELAIIIPVYNEEKSLELFFNNLKKELVTLKYSLTFINDGSQDNTYNILKKKQNNFNGNMQIIDVKKNKGVGNSFKLGLKEVLKKYNQPNQAVVIMEGDNTNSFKYLNPMLKKINQGADVVIASRYCSQGKTIGFPLLRKFLSKAGNLFLQKYLKIKVSDFSIFFRMYRASILKQAANKYQENLITQKNFSANFELFLKLNSLTAKISEVPFVYNYNLKQSKSNFKILNNLREYLVIIYKVKKESKRYIILT